MEKRLKKSTRRSHQNRPLDGQQHALLLVAHEAFVADGVEAQFLADGKRWRGQEFGISKAFQMFPRQRPSRVIEFAGPTVSDQDIDSFAWAAIENDMATL